MIDSSSPSPSPVRLSPVWVIEPSLGAQLLEPDGVELVAGLVEHDAGGVEVDVLGLLARRTGPSSRSRPSPGPCGPWSARRRPSSRARSAGPWSCSPTSWSSSSGVDDAQELERLAGDLLGGVDVLALGDRGRRPVQRPTSPARRPAGTRRRRRRRAGRRRAASRPPPAAGSPRRAPIRCSTQRSLVSPVGSRYSLRPCSTASHPSGRIASARRGGEALRQPRELADGVEEALVAVAHAQQPAIRVEDRTRRAARPWPRPAPRSRRRARRRSTSTRGRPRRARAASPRWRRSPSCAAPAPRSARPAGAGAASAW